MLKDGVVAVLADVEGRYLLIKRGAVKRSPGWWCFVGGEVDPGETLEAAMAREVKEEVGLRVSVHDKVHECVSPDGVYRLHWFLTRLDPPEQTPVAHPEEVAELRWLSIPDALRLDPLLPRLKDWLASRL
jgi:8-oxo-dGTP diphosphatase